MKMTIENYGKTHTTDFGHDDINITDDDHPNFKAHEIIADVVYQNILKHPLYTTI